MNASWRALLIAGLLTATLSSAGCSSMWHNFQPHRLHQLNRGPGMVTGPEAYSLKVAVTEPVA